MDTLQDNPSDKAKLRQLTTLIEPDMTVLQAGAHTGMATAAIARTIGDKGRIYAFEPVPEYCSKLRDSLDRFNIRNVSIFQMALTDKTARIPFYKRDVSSSIIPGGGDMLYVEAITVDEFCTVENTNRVDFIKLHCCGSEFSVLQGAKMILTKYSPRIFAEIFHTQLVKLNQSVADIEDYLENLNYHIDYFQITRSVTEAKKETCSHLYASPHKGEVRSQQTAIEK